MALLTIVGRRRWVGALAGAEAILETDAVVHAPPRLGCKSR